MYPYHNRIKQRLRNGELVSHYKADNYPGIGPGACPGVQHPAVSAAYQTP